VSHKIDPDRVWRPSPRFTEFGGCLRCRHYRRDGRCLSYPDRPVPLPFASGATDHMVRRPDDNGYLFEPRGKNDPLAPPWAPGEREAARLGPPNAAPDVQ
jgi:hypothetical protein